VSAPFPMLLVLEDRPVLVAGGGPVAARKVRHLRAAGARVRLVSPEVVAAIEDLAGAGALTWERRRARPEDVAADPAPVLVFACTSDPEANAALHDAARARGVPCNRADLRGGGDFQLPSRVGEGPVRLMASTGGRSPALARLLRLRLEEVLAEGWDRAALALGELLDELEARLPDAEARRRFWDGFLVASTVEALLAGDRSRIREEVERCVSSLSG